MRAVYFAAMDHIHRACLFVAGLSLLVITLIIPWGVFTRYVLNSAASWPEPLAILIMIVLSFLSAVICYREHLHISILALPNMLSGVPRLVLGLVIEACMLFTNLFLLWYGTNLVKVTWHQSIAEFPAFSAGMTYLPVPIGGFITALFVIERLMKGNLFPAPHDPDQPDTLSAE